jgi:hypothetical protein
VRRIRPGGPAWLRVVVVVALLLAAFLVAQTCQQSQIRVTKEQAAATARGQIDFTPQRTQIRLLRQGITSQPFWIVSLSVPGADEGTFSELAVVRVDANSGEVADVKIQR